MTIRIEIEHIVLDRALLETSQVATFRAALDQELARLFGEAPSTRRSVRETLSTLRPRETRAPSASRPQRLGRRTAGQIHQAIRGAR
jgi:hypothetical protein